VILKGPTNTLYHGKFWTLYVEFDSHYPNCASNVRFITPIYHVNISGDGKICHQILDRCWCSQTITSKIFENILDLLKKSNFYDAMSLKKAHLDHDNPDDYKMKAELHSNKYATNYVKTFKSEYQLEGDG
jgi:ubiquitin-conjugating enzyme E2 D/E